MKRSEYIALGAVGLLAVATFWPRGGTVPPPPNDPALTAGDGFQTLAFESVEECRQSQAVTQAICDTEFGAAQVRSLAEAPKFDALADCEAEYGASACRPATWNGASVFVPALAGVLIARSLANAGQFRSQPLYPPTIGPSNCPTGVDVNLRPECAPRQASSSSSGGGGGSSSSSRRVHYSTGTGRVIARTVGAVVVDALYPSRTNFPRASSTVLRTGGVSTTTSRSSSSSSSSSFSRSSTSTTSSSSPTVSRGGFGSTGRSMSSSS